MTTSVDTGRPRRRRVLLTPVDPVPVPFSGARAGEGPLTLGQLNTAQWLEGMPDHAYAVLCVELPVPDGVTTDDVAATIAVLLARHESLRTHYARGEHRRQVVAASGVLELDVCSLGEGEWGPRDRPAVAGQLVAWLRERRGTVTDLPRVVVATGADGAVVACAAAFSHMAVDLGAIEVVKREFAEMLADPARREVGPPRHQPLDQAELEATPAERRRAEVALAYLRDQSERVPHNLYALPGTRAGGEPVAVELSSAAAAMAVREVAARTRASRSAIVLAALCAVLSRRTGYRELVFPLLSSNRFDRRLAGYVGSLAQGTLVTVEVGDRGFDALVKHTWTAVLEASRHAGYDGADRGAMSERIEHERGLKFLYDPLFNSLVPESWSGINAGVKHRPEQIAAALRHTGLTWRPVHRNGTPVRFGLNQVDGRLRLDAWSADIGVVSRAEMESVLLAVEAVLVGAAGGDLDAGQVRGLIALDPVERPPGWVLVDGCWVDLAEVQRLLDDALAPSVARIFPAVDGRALVAHLTATDAVRTPEQAHARCMAALPDRLNALAPRHYVVCATAPADPADPAAWPAPLAAGAGRSADA
ncbi:condensation domain-containing protein [Actinosynnema sp. NPDC004786]